METVSSPTFLPFHMPSIDEDDMRAVREVMENGWITTGPKAVEFEQEFARYVSATHAVAVNSGTAALHLALEAAGVDEDDEVIVPTLTFAATAEAAVYRKARPVLVDCDPETLNIDPVKAERAISARTRAIVPVHFGGHPCEMDTLLRMARAHRVLVIEDAAHALPARYRGRPVGALGDITCFSFYATKSITTGEGGMATTANAAWAERMRVMRLHGISKDAWKRYAAEGSWRYEILAPGFKYNLTDMQAALGLSQLARCGAMWARRASLAARYTEELRNLGVFELPYAREDVQHAWHLYPIRIRSGALSIHRDRVIEELKQRGIGTSVHFIPLHLHPYYRDRWGYRAGDFPVAEDYFDRCISLPLYPAMSDGDQTRVIEALGDVVRRFRRPVLPGAAQLSAASEATTRTGAVATAGPERVAGIAVADAMGKQKGLNGDGWSGGWYTRFGKRLLDVTGALTALAVASPLFAVCAMVVHFSSPGPVLFRQHRVGKNQREFELLKFRTMALGRSGMKITAAGDYRITAAGRWLRRTKLDELPQLLNVLKGEMSLVGPRPEVPEYVAVYSRKQCRVFQRQPGITSPASLAFIDEESLLAAQSDREAYYTRVLLPRKLEIDLAYCHGVSFKNDIKILLATAWGLWPAKRGPGSRITGQDGSRFDAGRGTGSQAA